MMSVPCQPDPWRGGPIGAPEHPWRVETSASLQECLENPACAEPLRHALGTTLSWQFRCETTLRQVLASPRLAPQLVAALLTCGAVAAAEDGAQGVREPLGALLETGQGGRVAWLEFPALDGVCWGEAHVARAPADEPIVAAWAAVRLDGPRVREARLALTGVWNVPARLAQAADLLLGGPLDEARIRAVATAVGAEVTPPDDYLGSAEYRRAMAGVLASRALVACWQAQEGRNEQR